jgi:hypothetical protein
MRVGADSEYLTMTLAWSGVNFNFRLLQLMELVTTSLRKLLKEFH